MILCQFFDMYVMRLSFLESCVQYIDMQRDRTDSAVMSSAGSEELRVNAQVFVSPHNVECYFVFEHREHSYNVVSALVLATLFSANSRILSKICGNTIAFALICPLIRTSQWRLACSVLACRIC